MIDVTDFDRRFQPIADLIRDRLVRQKDGLGIDRHIRLSKRLGQCLANPFHKFLYTGSAYSAR